MFNSSYNKEICLESISVVKIKKQTKLSKADLMNDQGEKENVKEEKLNDGKMKN